MNEEMVCRGGGLGGMVSAVKKKSKVGRGNRDPQHGVWGATHLFTCILGNRPFQSCFATQAVLPPSVCQKFTRMLCPGSLQGDLFPKSFGQGGLEFLGPFCSSLTESSAAS